MSHAGKVLLEGVARRLTTYCENNGMLPEEQCVFQPDCSTTGMLFMITTLQEIRRKAGASFFPCFLDVQTAYDIVDGTLMWQVLTRTGVPPQMTAVIKHSTMG